MSNIYVSVPQNIQVYSVTIKDKVELVNFHFRLKNFNG